MVDKKEMREPKAKTTPKEMIKNMIRQLHEGRDIEEVKAQFQDILSNISPTEIAQVEQELVKEGMLEQDIRRLCDVHLAIFRESLDKEKIEVEVDHPINVFMEEHKIILQHLEELKNIFKKIGVAKSFAEINQEISRLKQIADHLLEIEKHNIREENVLFPYLEKHGIAEPPAIMWAEHNELKEKKKQLLKLLEAPERLPFPDFARELAETGGYIAEKLANHIYKENHILYPAALRTISEDEWREIRNQCDELGYCCFTPSYLKPIEVKRRNPAIEGGISFETGNLTPEELEAFLNSLPVDVTFVDAEDTVRYFNKTEERIFPRTKAIIGRKVQQCHPSKSVHIVNQVIDDLRNGRRKSADFWIDINGKKIYIRYFPVRNNRGKYLGCIEVTQDITQIQKIKGERRLLSETKSS